MSRGSCAKSQLLVRLQAARERVLLEGCCACKQWECTGRQSHRKFFKGSGQCSAFKVTPLRGEGQGMICSVSSGSQWTFLYDDAAPVLEHPGSFPSTSTSRSCRQPGCFSGDLRHSVLARNISRGLRPSPLTPPKNMQSYHLDKLLSRAILGQHIMRLALWRGGNNSCSEYSSDLPGLTEQHADICPLEKICSLLVAQAVNCQPDVQVVVGCECLQPAQTLGSSKCRAAAAAGPHLVVRIDQQTTDPLPAEFALPGQEDDVSSSRCTSAGFRCAWLWYSSQYITLGWWQGYSKGCKASTKSITALPEIYSHSNYARRL